MYAYVASTSSEYANVTLRRIRIGRSLECVQNTPEARKEIGERIARARLTAGYENAAEFARLVGVQPNTLYRWERGDLVPSIWYLEGVSRIARVSSDWILRGTAEPRLEILEEWRRTPRGQTATEAQLSFLRALPLEGYTPTLRFYNLALSAIEEGLSPADVALAARVTEAKIDR